MSTIKKFLRVTSYIFLILLFIFMIYWLLNLDCYYVNKYFGDKSTMWTAFSAVVTSLSILGAYILPKIELSRKEQKEKELLIDSLVNEIYFNWQSFSSELVEIKPSRSLFDKCISDYRLIQDSINHKSFGKISNLTNKLSAYQFLLENTYMNLFALGKEEVGDTIKKRGILSTISEQKYQCIVEFISVLEDKSEKQKNALLKLNDGESYEQKRKLLVETYKRKITRESIKNIITR